MEPLQNLREDPMLLCVLLKLVEHLKVFLIN